MKLRHVLIIVALSCALAIEQGCKKSPDIQSPNTPLVTTKPVVNISSTSVVSGGELANATNIIDKGILWGTDSNLLKFPNSNKISNGAGVSDFTDTLKNLMSGTTYYVRAYAMYGSKIAYGAAVKFSTLPPEPTVYLAGYNGNNAVYWKNGKSIPLPDGSFAHFIYVVGNDVYAAGEGHFNSNIRALYWKNGTAVPLTNGNTTAVANSIYVVGNDVYVAGYEAIDNSSNITVAKYWKNGIAIPLTAGTAVNSGIALSIYVVGNDVYVAGFRYNFYLGQQVATYWRNGVPVALSDSSNSIGRAQSIFVKDNDVYVAGEVKHALGVGGVYVAKYWKNGTEVSLTNGTQFADANSIYVVGNDVYIAGYEDDPITGYSVAKYWKNGTAFPLSTTLYANAQSIRVVSNDVYVAGWESEDGYYIKARYWKNGVSIPLEINSNFSIAVSNFVQ
jgi:hypothetical protein